MSKRIIPIESIPAELWNDRVTFLPAPLVAAYRECLLGRGLLEQATGGSDKKGIYGGPGEAETLEHFAFRYAVSAARAEMVALDPLSSLQEIPRALLTTLSEGHVGMLDLPCGPLSTAASLDLPGNSRSIHSLETAPGLVES